LAKIVCEALNNPVEYHFDFPSFAGLGERTKREAALRRTLGNPAPSYQTKPCTLVDKNGIIFCWLLPGVLTRKENVCGPIILPFCLLKEEVGNNDVCHASIRTNT
jgi:hypothetical protein